MPNPVRILWVKMLVFTFIEDSAQQNLRNILSQEFVIEEARIVGGAN